MTRTKAASFQFKDKRKKLTIEGHEFEVLVGDIEALSAGHELAERLKAVDPETLGAEGYRKLTAEIRAAVDQALGEGATAKIIGDRRATVTGLVQLLMFVLIEANADFGGAVDSLVAEFTEIVDED